MKCYNNITKRIFSLILVMVSVLTLLPATPAFAAENDTKVETRITTSGGCWGIASVNKPVYSSSNLTSQIGTIYAQEGFTILIYGSPMYVEYSTSSGTKRGYISNTDIGFDGYLAQVTGNTIVYYGPDISEYQQAGAVYSGEYVCVLCQMDDWVYIEYNTTAGRKRGYAKNTTMQQLSNGHAGTLYMFDDNYTVTEMYYSGSATVYAGPSSQYASIGSIANENILKLFIISYQDGSDAWAYIEYYVTGTTIKKSGFIPF